MRSILKEPGFALLTQKKDKTGGFSKVESLLKMRSLSF